MLRLGEGMPRTVIVAKGMEWPRFDLMTIAIARLLEMNLSVLILGGLVINFVLVFGHALLFYALGEDCYDDLDDSFGLEEMFWLSIHTFTTVSHQIAFALYYTFTTVSHQIAYAHLTVARTTGWLRQHLSDLHNRTGFGAD